jgi:xanthine dehydrogenase accessory factor
MVLIKLFYHFVYIYFNILKLLLGTSMVSWLKTIEQLSKKNIPAIIITIIKTRGSSPAKSGTKLIVSEEKIEYGTIGGGKLEYQAIKDAKSLLKSNKTILTKEYPLGAAFGQCCGGSVELFMEVINTSPVLYIFGAGHIGFALSKIMKNTIFEVKLIDSRENWFDQFSLESQLEFISEETDFFKELVQWSDSKTYLIVLTHLHDLDQQIIEFSIKEKTKYIGLIGSQTKWKQFQKRILQKNDLVNELSKVHCPVGLDIGGETPQEIAISIASELLKTYYEK